MAMGVAVRRFLAYMAVLAGLAAHAQSPPPPAPVITRVSPDRVAVGDVITLEGEHFLAGDAQAAVRFGSLLVTVAPLSDTRIDVAVPDGAAKGSVTVTTTAQADGRTIEQTSNPAAILVMWKRADLAPLLPANTTVYRKSSP